MGTILKHMAIIAFTADGLEMAQRIAAAFEPTDDATMSAATAAADASTTSAADSVQWHCSVAAGFGPDKVPHQEWTAENFSISDALVCVGATVIAIRSIAPYVNSKVVDPAVLTVDVAGTWCIPLLSGHLGGANEIAQHLASAIGATATITTATDVHDCWAVAVWAKANHLHVANSRAIKVVSSRILAGEPVLVYSPLAIAGDIPAGLTMTDDADLAQVVIHEDLPEDISSADFPADQLHLVAQTIVAGMGCRKGVVVEVLDQALTDALAEAQVNPLRLRQISSIDVKSDEPGLLELARMRRVPFAIYTAEELAEIEGVQNTSDFVASAVGVDNVCERSALASGGTLIFEKHIYDRSTVALAQVQPALAW